MINQLKLNQLEEGDTYKYLGMDENISYNGKLNKERITTEYFSRIKKIWKSKLSAFNKSIAHNMFAVPILTPTYGILDWTIEEIKNIDIKTRKILCMQRSFHINSDTDCLYIPRSDGGRGLKSIQTAFECRIISLSHHLNRNKNRNYIMNFINIAEEIESKRVAAELRNKFNIAINEEEHPSKIGRMYAKAKNKDRYETYKNKVMHGFMSRKIESDNNIDQGTSKSWTRNKFMTSEFESYAFAIKDQELPTKYLKCKRNKDPTVSNTNCRLCKNAVEDITHITSSCPLMSVRYYLPIRHDVIAKTVYNALICKENPLFKKRDFDIPEYICTEGNCEYWWNVSVETATKIKHNKPDLIVWNRHTKICYIIEFSCPADINVSKKVEEKITTYGPLVRNLQIMYQEYKFKMLPIIVGALGTIPKSTKISLKELNFSTKETNTLVRKLQAYSIKGTVQICKTFLRFSE